MAFANLNCVMNRILVLALLASSLIYCRNADPSADEPDTPETVFVVNKNSNSTDIGGYLYAFDATTATKKWEVKLDLLTGAGPTLANGIVYFGGVYKLLAVDASTGTKKWEVRLNQSNRFYHINESIPVVANGLVYVNASDSLSKLCALDALTGVKKWEFTVEGELLNSPTVTNGIVYVSAFKKLYALDAFSGATKWQVDVLGFPTNSSVVDGTIYTNSDKLYAHDALTGALKWMSTYDYVSQGSPTVANGLLFIRSSKIGTLDPAGMHVIDTQTGKLLRDYYFETEYGISLSPIAVNGVVYIGSGNISFSGSYLLYAYDISPYLPYKTKWTQQFKSVVGNLTVANGTVFMGTQGLGVEATFSAIDASTGVIKWAIHSSNPYSLYSAACVVTKKGVVYHAAESGDQQ